MDRGPILVLYSSVDYNGMELCSWAQVCLWTVGHSRLAEVINNGLDPHTELGARIAGIAKDVAYALKKAGDEKFTEEARQPAKIADFGFPGGMGAATLKTQARKEYKVHRTLAFWEAVRESWRIEWPEGPEYHRWVDTQLRDTGGKEENGRAKRRGSFTQFLSGRVRGNCSFTQGANTLFQGLAADAWSAAGWELAKECYLGVMPNGKPSPLYGCRTVIPLHDEYLIEVPSDPERAHLAAHRQRDVMVEVAQRWHPQVRITAEPCLMHRWSKKAKTIYKDGLLVPGDALVYA